MRSLGLQELLWRREFTVREFEESEMMELVEEDESEWNTPDGGINRIRMKDDPKVILHFDMDCFYAQVEMIRNPDLRSKPLGVQQKYLIVTCNYMAREQGVAKLMSVKEALEKCPALVLVKGEDLTFYREISYKVTELLMSYCPLVERLGLDENFIDVTEMVESRKRNMNVSELSFVGHVYGHDVSSVGVRDHVNLALGSVIACELRETLFSRLGLTSCAGVANSKLLAKLVSGTFKPNQQTTLLPASSSQMMDSLSAASRVPGVGYRTAERLKALGVFSVRDLQLFPLSRLVCEFGEANAKRIQSLARGIDPSPVTPAGPPQSLSDEDSFKKISTLSEAQNKITELLLSLSERMHKDGRIPQTLRLTLRRSGAASRWFSRESRQSPIPTHTARRIANSCPEAVPQLVSIAMKLLHKLVDVRESFHLTLLNVCFTNLQNKLPSRNTISSFFTSTQPKALCGKTNPQNNRETPSSSSSSSSSSSCQFYQQPIEATSSLPPVSESSDPRHELKHVPELPSDVDPEVFRSLPQHIQLELMSSFQNDSTKRQDLHCASVPRTQHSDDLITQLCTDPEEPSDVSTADVSADVPPNVDPYVFSQLPPDMQTELRMEWKQSELKPKIVPRPTARQMPTSRNGRSASKRSHSGSLLSYFRPSADKRL